MDKTHFNGFFFPILRIFLHVNLGGFSFTVSFFEKSRSNVEKYWLTKDYNGGFMIPLHSPSAFHPPTRGLRVGSRGNFSISWVGSRLPRQKRKKMVRGSGGRVGSSHRNWKKIELETRRVGQAVACGGCGGKGNGLDGGCCIFFVQQPNTAWCIIKFNKK